MSHDVPFARFTECLRAEIDSVARGGDLPASRFDVLAAELFALQWTVVSPYRRLCEYRGLGPEAKPDWREIPALPTSAFKEFEVTSLSAERRTAVFHSSQTTGERPSRHFHDPASLALYELAALTGFRLAAGLAAGDRRRVLCLTPSPSAAPRSSLVHMFDLIRREHGDAESSFFAGVDASGAWGVDTAAAWEAIEIAAARREPVVLLGTAFSYVHLFDACPPGPTAVTLPPGSIVLETGGYKGRSRSLPRAEFHRRLTMGLGVPSSAVLCEYGMSELSSQAYRPGDAAPGANLTARVIPPGVFQFPPWARAVVVSPDTGNEVADGETGLLRILDLANVRSVMALQTEDLVVRRGSGFDWVGRVPQAEPRGCSRMAVDVAA